MNTKKLLSAAASIITAGALIVGGTMAYFTSTDSSTGNTLGAGTLIIELRDLAGDALGEESAIITAEDADNMYPDGPSVFACAAVVNAGTLDFNWTIKGIETSGADPNLADVLLAKTHTWVGDVDGPTSLDDCDDEDNWVTDDAEVPLNALLPLGEIKQGELQSGEEAYYRWEFYLPSDVGNAYQGVSTELTFEVKAYQTNDDAYDDAF